MKFRERWKCKKNTSVYLVYTITYVIAFFVAFSVFFFYGKIFLGTGDGVAQHLPSMQYTSNWFAEILSGIFKNGELHVKLWDISIGFGGGIFANAISFRPLGILFGLLSAINIEVVLFLRIFTYLYLDGIAFVAFAKTRSDSRLSIVIGALVYLFSGYSLFFAVRHTFFLEMMFFFPLLILGVDRIMEKGKSKLFVTIVFFCGISYFYFLYMITIPAVIYAAFRYFELFERSQRNVKHFLGVLGNYAWRYLLGILLAAFSLVPWFCISIESSRVAVANSDTSFLRYIFGGINDYLNLIRSVTGTNEFGLYGYIAVAGIAIFCVAFLAFERDKKNRIYVWQVILYFVVALVPALSMFFSAFAGRTQRWTFVLIFWLAICVVTALPRMVCSDVKVISKCLGATAVYVLLACLASWYQKGNIGPTAVFTLLYAMVLLASRISEENKNRMILGIVLVNIFWNSVELYGINNGDYISSFVDRSEFESEDVDNPGIVANQIDDDSVYRVDVAFPYFSQKVNQKNYGYRLGIAGVSSYFSYCTSGISEYSLDVGNSQMMSDFNILDLDQRTVLNELAGVKYVVMKHSHITKRPYGYELVDQIEYTDENDNTVKYDIYENTYALPLMYVYNSYISQEDFDALETYEKEQAMLQGVVLETDPGVSETKLRFSYKVELSKEEIVAALQESYGDSNAVEIYDDHISVNKTNQTLTIEIPKNKRVDEAELYVVMNGLDYTGTNPYESELEALGDNASTYDVRALQNKYRNWEAPKNTYVTITAGKYKDQTILRTDDSGYTLTDRDVLFNLGTVSAGKIKINFKQVGDYYFDDLKVVAQPMANYWKKAAKLQATPVNDIEIEQNHMSGSVYSDSEKMLCVAVPYSSGWTATVNGQETEVYKANDMYMAIKIPAGYSEVTFVYRTPGLKTGLLISLISAMAAIGGWAVLLTYRKKSSQKFKK